MTDAKVWCPLQWRTCYRAACQWWMPKKSGNTDFGQCVIPAMFAASPDNLLALKDIECQLSRLDSTIMGLMEVLRQRL